MPNLETPRRRSLRSLCAAAILGLAAIAFLPQAAWAQGKNQKEPTPEELKGYTLPYFFTVVAVLAMIVPLCWPSLRKWEVPNEKEE